LVRNLSADDLFFDVDTIPKGVDFRNHIRGSIIDSAVMLAVMGPGWIGRLQGKPWQFWRSAREDFVSIELESAIENGIPILPVLVRGAQMPTASALPTALKVMTYANAAELRSGKFQMRDLEHIAAAIRQFRD
jgi:hypothetical protein